MIINNVLFIVPPHGALSTFKPTEPGQKKLVPAVPYGLLSMASYVHSYIEIFDCNQFILDNINRPDLEDALLNELKYRILKMKPDCIGISALFDTSLPQMVLIPFIKTCYPSAYIIVGGGLATNMYLELLTDFRDIDAICYGEGEIPLKKILGVDFTDPSLLSPAWITKWSLSRGQKPEHDFIENLDDLPIIDYGYIDIKKYNGRSLENKSTESKVELTIHTSRGCPFNCVFCASHSVHGKKVRMMSIRKIVKTVNYYKDKYGMTNLIVEDDNFLYDKDRALILLDFVRAVGVHIEFATGVAVHRIDADVAKAMAEAKVSVVTLAIESGSDYVLKTLIDKPLTVATIEKAVLCLKKVGIRVHAFVVIGVPGESDYHRRETLELLLRLKIDWVYVFIAIPVVGSRLYDLCKDKGYIDPNYNKHVIGRGSIIAPGIDPKHMEDCAYCMAAVVNLLENTNMKNGNYDVAENYFKMVVRSYPKEAIAHHMLAKLHNLRYAQYKNDLTDLAFSTVNKLSKECLL